MKTISDLKLTANQIIWMCENTEDFKHISFGILSAIEDRKSDFNKPGLDKLYLQAFIYQATDGISITSAGENNIFNCDKGIEAYCLKGKPQYEEFRYENYDTKTTARLAALQWLAIQNGCKGE